MLRESNSPKTPYDEVPYESAPFRQTHPDRLATLGRLFGILPAPVDNCRVLELGCAGGGNLLPMAFHLPESRFVGVDLSRRQVAEGQQVLRDLELANIDLVCASIMDVDFQWGEFDYIICHGVYSWVPDEVQEKILFICEHNLAPQGIAYISYNTYPGWHMREMIRRMMLFHTRQFDDTQERIEQSRAVIDFLAHSVPTENNCFGLLLRNELDLIRRSKDAYLFHEHLEAVNAPVYFHEFMEKADQHGLQYLAEADFASMLTCGFPREVQGTLDKISSDIIHLEQYMDFVRNRSFRQTLLCRRDLRLRRELKAEALDGLMAASPAYPLAAKVDLDPDVRQIFQAPNGASIESGFALTKAALLVLHDSWPYAIGLDTLINAAQGKLAEAGIELDLPLNRAKATLADDLLHCYGVNALAFHTWQADFTRQVSPRPQASRLALYQANHDLPVVNQRHERVNLDFFSKTLLGLLDGNHDHDQLIHALIRLEAEGALALHHRDQPVSGPDQIRSVLDTTLQKTMNGLARSALLVV